MKIGIIGAGSMGATLARHLAKLGHDVSIANSRGPESLAALAAEVGATPVSVVDAAKASEIVILAMPTKAVADFAPDLFANVPDSVVVIDIGNYHPELRDGPIDAIDNSWRQQTGTPAYCKDLEAAALRRALAEADRSRIAVYRAEEEARIRRHIAAQAT